MNTLTDLLLGVGQPRVSHFPDLCTLLYTYLSTLDYWTKIVYYLFTQTSPVAHTSALTPTYIKSQKLPNWPISKELGLGRMLLPHWKLLLKWRHKYVSAGLWYLGHHAWFGVRVYLQAGPDLQGGADLNRGLALTWLRGKCFHLMTSSWMCVFCMLIADFILYCILYCPYFSISLG